MKRGKRGRGRLPTSGARRSRREEMVKGREREKQTDKQKKAERKRERDRRWAGPPFKSKCTQEVLLVATVEHVSCQDPKDRPVQMPEC